MFFLEHFEISDNIALELWKKMTDIIKFEYLDCTSNQNVYREWVHKAYRLQSW